jgi:hypothetical protein
MNWPTASVSDLAFRVTVNDNHERLGEFRDGADVVRFFETGTDTRSGTSSIPIPCRKAAIAFLITQIGSMASWIGFSSTSTCRECPASAFQLLRPLRTSDSGT